MRLEKLINDPRLPQHIAFIIDGNGRWAKHRGLPRSAGHKVGAENVEKQIGYIKDLGIKNVSVYCFSSENWNRPQKEVDYLMKLFDEMMDKYREKYINENVRIVISGDMDDSRLPKSISQKAKILMEDTKNKTDFVINLCINYGGRQEILNVVNKIIANGEKEIDGQKFEQYLYTKDLLPLDLIIRTSGEQRSSNFMPWQSVYSEWYYPKTPWPAFSKRELVKALIEFSKRNRRFGAIKG